MGNILSLSVKGHFMRSMITYLVLSTMTIFSLPVYSVCQPGIPLSTPDSQLIDNGDGTVTDTITGLMWKKCSEGQSNNSSCSGTAASFSNWQQILQRPGIVNTSGGFAGYTDWRLPNVKELRSIVETACTSPAINETRFPNTPSSLFATSSPYEGGSLANSKWHVSFSHGGSDSSSRNVGGGNVRLVRQ